MGRFSPLVQKVFAEAIGTFCLVLFGCGAIMVDQLYPGSLGHGGVCAAFGLVVAVMVSATGHVSGAHLNPAVTVAFASIGRFPWREVPAYVVGQLVAAVLAAVLLRAGLGTAADLGATQTVIGTTAGLLAEVLITAVLMFVITGVATDSRATGHHAALAIGGTVALCALVAGPLTGASMNPARSLGPALAAGVSASQWIYLLGPLLGAALGARFYEIVRCDDPGVDAAGCC